MISMKRVEVFQVDRSSGAAKANFVTPGGGSPEQGIIAGQVTNWVNAHANAKPIEGAALQKLESSLAGAQHYDVTPQFEMGVGRTLYVFPNKTAYLEETSTDLNASQRWIKMEGFKMPAAFPREMTDAEVPAHAPGGTIKSAALPPYLPKPSAVKAIYSSDIKQAILNGTAKTVQSLPAGKSQMTFSIPVFGKPGPDGTHFITQFNVQGRVYNGELYAINKDTQPNSYLDCGRAPLFE
jgi:hypothetical protein